MRGYSYRDLEVWKKSMDMDVVVQSCGSTRTFPASEQCGLAGQIQRAAVSVAANIAEGQARQHRKVFLHHLSIAHGSTAELETHIEIAKRIGYVRAEIAHPLFSRTEEVGRMINGLRKFLRQSRPPQGRSAD
jgi:four helix bundle protein